MLNFQAITILLLFLLLLLFNAHPAIRILSLIAKRHAVRPLCRGYFFAFANRNFTLRLLLKMAATHITNYCYAHTCVYFRILNYLTTTTTVNSLLRLQNFYSWCVVVACKLCRRCLFLLLTFIFIFIFNIIYILFINTSCFYIIITFLCFDSQRLYCSQMIHAATAHRYTNTHAHTAAKSAPKALTQLHIHILYRLSLRFINKTPTTTYTRICVCICFSYVVALCACADDRFVAEKYKSKAYPSNTNHIMHF